MVEYFLFHFVSVITALPQSNKGTGGGAKLRGLYRQLVQDALWLLDPTEFTCRWEMDTVARLYLKVLQSYLDYVLPVRNNGEHVYNSRLLRRCTLVANQLTEYFFALISELWLLQYEYHCSGDILSTHPV